MVPPDPVRGLARLRVDRARHAAQHAFEELKQAQSRLLITQNAASQGRLAAALSHELNSPIGALSSAIETLASAYKKLESAVMPYCHKGEHDENSI